jgi:hypothetical protein
MLRSVRFHKLGFGVLGLALVFLLGLRAFPGSPGAHSASYKTETKPATAPSPAPPVTVDSLLPNLFYGAIPQGETPSQSNAPVLVFVHGLSGSYADWLESNNCPPSPTPCGPNGPGAGTGNDMYDYAYAAGFRTAFMSLSANNLSNSSNIQTNAAMLETMFPRILAYFNVTKVYFVCHSKGGLDLQAALASTPPPPAAPWIGIANAVFTFGTPNQGDALASWLFLTPNGQAVLAAFPTLNNAGVQALEISNVEAFRSQWDPLFENAQVPFYTVAGDVCVATSKYPNGDTPACTNGGTGPILQSITGTAKPCETTPQGPGCPPPNDWLVTEPETILPASYAMALGVELENHYQLRLGDNSWGIIYARVMAQEAQQNGQPGLTRIATNGFGNAANTEAWSMAWFTNASGQSNLYVGTGRDVYCVTSADAAIESGLPALYPPAVGDCNPDYHLLELQAEIWQYTPTTNTWLRVFQSPNSLTTTDTAGATVPTARDIGIRSLTVVNEPAGVTALYAGTVTSAAIFETNHTVGGWPPPRILRSTDGVTWNPIPEDANTFLGQLSAAGGGVACPTCPGASQSYQNIGIRSGGQLNGITYFQVGNYSGVGRVIATLPGANPSQGDNNYQYVSPPAGCDEPGQTPGVAPCLGQLLPVWILHTFNNFMYAGTGAPYAASGPATAYGVWKTNGTGSCGTNACAPYTWAQVVQGGAYAANEISNYALSFEVFSDTAPGGCSATAGTSPGAGGCLYVGTDQPSEMVRIHPDTTGQVPVANPDGSLDTMDSWDLVVGNPRTIPATATYGAGQSILPISGIGQYFDNGFTGHFWRMGVGGLGLYMSTYDSAGEASYPYNGNGNAAAWSQEFGTDLFRTPDGIHWTAVTKTGLGDGMNTGGRSFQATPFGLYWGTARPAVGGTQIFMIDNTQMDFNSDGVIDQKDVNLMTARLNTKAKPNDPMDMNQDGKITSADVQLLKTQCTYKNCAVPAVLPKQTTLTAPVLHSAPGALGSSATVSLDWPTVPNAVDYLVYQINMSPNGTQPPTLVGFPGPIEFVTRVTASGSTATFSQPSPTPTLQLLYFVRAEDDFGNLSAPSNLVGGPSLAAQ